MNFIVIMCDTMRPDHIGAYGPGLAKTPNLDKFAETAMLFDKAYCASWPTIPNRTDLFTGRYGEPFQPWAPLSYMDVTLPEVMRKNGYATQLINDTPHMINNGFGFDRPFNGWWMIRGNEVDRCWTDHHTYKIPSEESKVGEWGRPAIGQYCRNHRNRTEAEEDRCSPQVMQAASRWLEDNCKHDFFLWVDCFDPHEPWDPPQHYIDMYDPGYEGNIVDNFWNAPELTAREIQHVRAQYAGKVTMVDAWLGTVFDKIDNLGLNDNTAVLICSDHGTTLGDHLGAMQKKTPIYEENARIVWMMRVPGMTKPGARSQSLVQPPDLMPTFLEIAGLKAGYQPQGSSLVPLFNNPGEKVRDLAATGFFGVSGVGHPVTVTDGEWTYLHTIEPDENELYHTAQDPMQKADLIKEHPEIADKLREALFAEMESRGTPDWRMECYRQRKLVNVPEPTAQQIRSQEKMAKKKSFLPGRLEFLYL
jgi:arylsulfatase A-like enzyme